MKFIRNLLVIVVIVILIFGIKNWNTVKLYKNAAVEMIEISKEEQELQDVTITIVDIQDHYDPTSGEYKLYIKDTTGHLFTLEYWEDDIWLYEPNMNINIRYNKKYNTNTIIPIKYQYISSWNY